VGKSIVKSDPLGKGIVKSGQVGKRHCQIWSGEKKALSNLVM
jgi:hypothetical protein